MMLTPEAARIAATTIQAAIANTLAAVTQQVAEFNAQLKSGYMTMFDNWALSVTAGRIDNSNPPHPPKAYVVAYADDPTTGPGTSVSTINSEGKQVPIQWPYPSQAGGPVCDLPPVPAYTPPQVQIKTTGNESVMNVPPGDTWPLNTILTAPDGTHWEKTTRATPWGVASLYQKVA